MRTRTVRLRLLLVTAVVSSLITLGSTAGSATSGPPARSGHRHHGGFLVWSRFDDFETGTARLVRKVRGRRVTPLTHPAAGSQDIDPRISPDGRHILFERDTLGTSQAWVVRTDGRHEHQIDLGCVDPCAGTNTPSWTPDGHHLLYDRVSGPFNEAGDAASALLWKADLDGRHNARFSAAGLDLSTEETDPSFAPAGYLIVLHGPSTGHSAIFRLRADGTHPRRLTPWSLDADLPAVSPTASGPSHDLVVFETYGRGAPAGATQGPQVATLPASCRSIGECTRQTRYLTRSPLSVQHFNPSWSPDGRHIVYVRYSYDPPALPVGDIWAMKWNGAHQRPVSRDSRFEFRPAWGRLPRWTRGRRLM